MAGSSWHPSTDRLAGTDVYGSPGTSAAWATAFDKSTVNQFMFATGDCTKWLITTPDAVGGAPYGGASYTNAYRTVVKSSTAAFSYQARWYNRATAVEDPWISLTDHATAVTNGDLLYGENGYARSTHNGVLKQHQGADVYIR